MAVSEDIKIGALLASCEKLATDEASHWRLLKYIKLLDTRIQKQRKCNEINVQLNLERLQMLKIKTKFSDGLPSSKKLRSKFRPGYETDADALEPLQKLKRSKNYEDIYNELLIDAIRPRRALEDDVIVAFQRKNKQRGEVHYNKVQTENSECQEESANHILQENMKIAADMSNLDEGNSISSVEMTKEVKEKPCNLFWAVNMFIVILIGGFVFLIKAF